MKSYVLLLLSPLLFAVGNIIDSYLVTKYGEKEEGNVSGLLVIGGFFALAAVVVSFVLGFREIGLIATSARLLLVISGIISAASIFFYLLALKEDDPTAVTVWWQTIPFFTYILAYLFLGEQMTILQIIGGIIIVIGSLIVGMSESSSEKFSFSDIFNKKVIILMTLASLSYSVVAVIFKSQTILDNTYWGSSFYENLGVFFVGLSIFICYKKSRNTFYGFISAKEKPLLILNSFNELIFIAATLITQFVTLGIPLVAGSIINNTAPLFVFMLSVIFVKFFPGTIHDINLSKFKIIKSLVGIGLTIVGLVLLS